VGATPPGWYEDEHDPALARWWDGDRWTDHTLVIADQVPNVQPPPPPGFGQAPGSQAFLEDEEEWTQLGDDDPFGQIQEPPTAAYEREPEIVAPAAAATSVFAVEDHAPVFGGDWEVMDNLPPARRGAPTLGDRIRWLPTWAKVALPVAALLVLLLAVREADVPSLTTATFVELIPLACEALRTDDLTELGREIRSLRLDEPTTDRLLVGLERGVEEYCPDDLEANPDLFDDLYSALGVVRGSGASTSSSSSSSSSSSTTATTRATTTTRRTTTTTAPPTTAPPTTATTAPTTTATTAPTTSSTGGGIDL
jgi:hypothetical protein